MLILTETTAASALFSAKICKKQKIILIHHPFVMLHKNSLLSFLAATN